MNIDLNLLDYVQDLKIKNVDGCPKVFDLIRKNWFSLTPEELVRQCTIHCLIHKFQYSKSRFQVEKTIVLNEMSKRFDIVIYNKKVEPSMIVECKSYKVSIDQSTADQAARYNLIIGAPYVLLTNGIDTFCTHIIKDEIHFIDFIPTL